MCCLAMRPDQAACDDAGLMQRSQVQFHWQNRHPATGSPFASFDDFLASLTQEKRKKIRQERRKVMDAGVRLLGARGRHRGRGLGCFLPLLRAHLPRARQRALPDAGLLRCHGATHGRRLGAVHRRARRAVDCFQFDSCWRLPIKRWRPKSTGTQWPTAAIGGRWSGSIACTSRPATTSPSSGASARRGALEAARRASTRWRAP